MLRKSKLRDHDRSGDCRSPDNYEHDSPGNRPGQGYDLHGQSSAHGTLGGGYRLSSKFLITILIYSVLEAPPGIFPCWEPGKARYETDEGPHGGLSQRLQAPS